MPPATDELGMPLQAAGTDEYGMPLPQGAPGMPSPEVPANINLKPSVVDGVDQTPLSTRFANRTFFANDPVASANYLKTQGYAPPPEGRLEGNLSLGEVGRRGLDMVADLPRMAAMGVGALGGGLAGIETGPGAVATAALGAGAGDELASAGLSYLGSKLAGIEGSPGSAAIGGAVEGVGAEVGGRLLGKAINFFRDTINIPQGVAALKSLFKISPETAGRDVAETAAAKIEGYITPSELGLENNLDTTLTDPQILNLMKDAQTKPGNSLATLSADVQAAKSKAGEVLNGVYDENGQLVKPGVVQEISKASNSAIPSNQLEAESNKFIDEVTQQMSLADQSGKPLITKATDIRNELEKQFRAFKVGQSQEATAAAVKAKGQMTLLNSGGPDETGQVHEGLQVLKEKIAPLEQQIADGVELTPGQERLYQELKPKAVEMQTALDNATADYLKANAQAENPVFSFQALDDRKTALGRLGKFDQQPGRPDLAEAFKLYYGKYSNFLKAHAMAVNPELGAGYMEATERYSKLSDFEKIIPRAVGDSMMTPPQSLPGLAPSGREFASGALKLPGKLAKKTGFIQDAIQPTNNLTANSLFSRALRKLPDTEDPGAQFRGNFLTNAAGNIAGNPATAPVFGVPIARSISSYVSANTASAQEPDLTPLKNGATLSILIDSGMAPPNAKQFGFDLSQVPPEQMQQVNAQVMQVLGPLNDAIKFGSEDEIGAAYSQVIKQFPELFPPPKTGIKGEVEDSQGRVKLYDPTDRARYMGQVQVDSGMDWKEKAKVVSELNSTFTVLNPRKPK